MSEELKQCPFCGCSGSVWPIKDDDNAFVECAVCHARGPRNPLEGLAVYNWNRRADSDRIAALEKELVEVKIEMIVVRKSNNILAARLKAWREVADKLAKYVDPDISIGTREALAAYDALAKDDQCV